MTATVDTEQNSEPQQLPSRELDTEQHDESQGTPVYRVSQVPKHGAERRVADGP